MKMFTFCFGWVDSRRVIHSVFKSLYIMFVDGLWNGVLLYLCCGNSMVLFSILVVFITLFFHWYGFDVLIPSISRFVDWRRICAFSILVLYTLCFPRSFTERLP